MLRFFSRFSSVFWISLWFGLLTGLAEGVIVNFLRGVPGFGIRTSVEILWVAPVFDLGLFVLMGAAIGLVLSFREKKPNPTIIVGFFSWVAIFDILLIFNIIHKIAALVLSLGVGVLIGRLLQRSDKHLIPFFKRSTGILMAVVLLMGVSGHLWAKWKENRKIDRLPHAQHGAPNLLLIVLDTLRADHLSCYGYKRSTTPNIDRLSRNGVLFEHAIANSSWTLPSHVSLFTGHLPHEHKADWLTAFDGRFPTLAEMLASKGYITAAFSANTDYVSPEWGLGYGFTHFEVYGSSFADWAVRTIYGKRLALNLLPRIGYFDIPGRKTASEVNREALSWIDGVKQRPFFAFLNYMDMHDPYLTVAPYRTQYSDNPAKGDIINFQFGILFRRKPHLTRHDVQSEIDAYDGCLHYLDKKLGELISGLAKRGLDRQTLIIITSDHGESFGNHDLFGHGNSLYFESLHVPLIFYWPGRIPDNVKVSQVVSLHRIPTTIMELLFENNVSHKFPGISLSHYWSKNHSDDATDPVLAELTSGRFKGGPPNYPTSQTELKTLITEQWHYISSDSGREELYAWPKDLDESENLANNREFSKIIGELKTKLHRQLKTNAF